MKQAKQQNTAEKALVGILSGLGFSMDEVLIVLQDKQVVKELLYLYELS